MKLVLTVLLLVSKLRVHCLRLTTPNQKSYNGYQVIGVQIRNQMDLQAVSLLRKLNPTMDFWNEPEIGAVCDIMLNPSELPGDTFGFLGLSWAVKIENVGSLTSPSSSSAFQTDFQAHTSLDFWSDYRTLESIFSWMDFMQGSYPDIVSTLTIGYSYESRPMRMLKVSTAPSNASSSISTRPAVFLDSGIHAREWISPATLTYILYQLITNPQYQDILAAVDIYAVPVLNPDGYDYTHRTDRMWRKNRKPNPVTGCVGVDLNRNFPLEWCTLGASNDSCSDNYCGAGPSSEPETQAVMNFLLRDYSWWGYVTMHSYGQEWIIPWAYTTQRAPGHEAMWSVGKQAVNALESMYGTPFTLKSPTGRYGGFSMDWAKGVRNIKYPVLIELRDTGNRGFMLPPNQILLSGNETLAAIAAYLRAIVSDVRRTQGKSNTNGISFKFDFKTVTLIVPITMFIFYFIY